MTRYEQPLKLILRIVKRFDKNLFAIMDYNDITSWDIGIKWILTWMTQKVNLQLSQRIFDYLLSSPPSAILYFSAAYIIHRSSQLQNLDQNDLFTEFIEFFQQDEISMDDIEAIIQSSNFMITTYPSDILLDCNPDIVPLQDSLFFNTDLWIDTKF